MRKLLIALGVLAAVILVRPAPASAHFSLSIGLPGFGFFVSDPVPPPVVYAPPVYYPYAPPVVYRSYGYRPVYGYGYGGYGHRYYGHRYRHGYRW